MKCGRIIDFREALRYSLSSILLNPYFPDGTIQSSTKSTKTKFINCTKSSEADTYAEVGAYIVDLMVTI